MDLNIRKLAQLAGTSYSTVSRALNNSPLVKDTTKRRIQELAAQLGYDLDFSAKSLATGVRTIIGIVYPYHSLRPYESAYTSQAIDRMRRQLSLRGFDALVAGYGSSGAPEDDITRLIRQKKVDGLIVFGYEIAAPQVEVLRRVGAPFLLINPSPSLDDDECNLIHIDHELGGYLAGRRLIEAGRHRLLCVTEEGSQFTDRTVGFRRAVEEMGTDAATAVRMESLILENGLYETAYGTVEEHIDGVRQFDGIFVQSDISTVGVLNCLLDHGINVPRATSLVGYDDIEWAQYTRPALTTIHQPVREVAELAAEGILSMISGDSAHPYRKSLQPVLVNRESC